MGSYCREGPVPMSGFWKRATLPLGAGLAIVLIVGGLKLRADYQTIEREAAGPEDIEVRFIPLGSPDDILPLEAPGVPPVTYRGRVSLDGLPVHEKKAKFFALMIPQVLIENRRLEETRAEVRRIMAAGIEPAEDAGADALWLKAMLERYRAENARDLLRRLEDHPLSVVLAQAALESGWGTSRFFHRANNVFGVWSFDANEPRIAAAETRGDQTIWVKAYPSLRGSIADYFLTIARGPYADFRRARLREDDPLVLIDHLQRYSELGDEYVRRLALTIRANEMQRFDGYRLDGPTETTEGS